VSGQSLRRDLVLADLRAELASAQMPLLDLGGSRRADHHADYLPASVGRAVVVNMDPSTAPDVVADAHSLPFEDGAFRTVVLSETLEHLHAPACAVVEIARVLAPRGRLVITVPFAFRVHGDPDDYHRFTPSGLRRLLAEMEIEKIQPQGGPSTVFGGVARDLLTAARPRWMPRFFAGWMIAAARRCARWDASPRVQRAPMLAGWTSGYLVVARRR
jgi:SAM-dependent methyltransferase